MITDSVEMQARGGSVTTSREGKERLLQGRNSSLLGFKEVRPFDSAASEIKGIKTLSYTYVCSLGPF